MLLGYALHQLMQMFFAFCLFLLGLVVTIKGVQYTLSRDMDMRSAVRKTSISGAQVTHKAVVDVNLAPSLESASQLIDSINQLVRTAVGVGVFLCLVGVVLCVIAFWMLSGISL